MLRRALPVIVPALMLAGASMPASAQQFVGLLANACQSVDAQGRVVLGLGAGVAIGRTIVVGVAADTADASGITVTDFASSPFRTLGGIKQRGADDSVALYAGIATASLPAGSPLTVRADLVPAGTELCVVAAVFDGLAGGALAQRGQGAATGSSNSLAVEIDHPTDMRRRLIAGVFAGDGAFGAITPGTSVSATPGVCAADGSPCITLLHASGPAALPTGTSIDALAGNAVAWRASGAVIAAIVIHADGFE